MLLIGIAHGMLPMKILMKDAQLVTFCFAATMFLPAVFAHEKMTSARGLGSNSQLQYGGHISMYVA